MKKEYEKLANNSQNKEKESIKLKGNNDYLLAINTEKEKQISELQSVNTKNEEETKNLQKTVSDLKADII